MRRPSPRLLGIGALCVSLGARVPSVQAQSVVIDGPPAPAADAVVNRDSAGRATVRAIRLSAPLTLDGRLDEEVYHATASVSDFIQQVPREGAPATERTESWVMFDGDTLYIAARCWDTAPPERWVANELRRDTNQLRQNDTFGVILDTFYDRRNGYLFYTNPLGARADQAVTDEGNLNPDWNPVWDVRTGRFAGGWTVEMAIPFKSLRYRSGSDQVWGINIRRVIRRKNEWTHLTPIPAAAGVPGGMFRLSRAGTLVGLDLPKASKNVELKPYGISRLTSDRAVAPAVNNDPSGDVGLDAKYGVTANLTADLTVNTDFAQVEVDEQQVNLTRFSILYPEKRDFFLEGRGLFDFARSGPANATQTLTPSVFYSRRIGLNAGRVIPIDVGGRLTGKVGPLRRRGDEHRDWRRCIVPDAADELLRGPSQTRHPAPQHDWRDRDQSLRVHGGARCLEPGVRCRRGVLLFPERQLRRATGHAPTPKDSSTTTTAIRGASITRATVTGCRRSI